MPTLKKLPWFSLALLLATYSTMGWALSALHDHWHAWGVALVSILLLNLSLSSPWSKTKSRLTNTFKSKTRTFFFTVVAAFLLVVIIAWLQVSIHALVAIASSVLFKLDVQTARMQEMQTFWALSIASLFGLALGGVAQTLI